MICLAFTFSLVGCAKCISTEQQTVEVKIVDEHFKPSTTTVEYNVVFKMPMAKVIPESYKIEVEYNNTIYTFTDYENYQNYKDKVGEYTNAILETRTYDDGTVKYDILSLE